MKRQREDENYSSDSDDEEFEEEEKEREDEGEDDETQKKKSKKYKPWFPAKRIKKIMQENDEVGKVASTVPVMVSRCLEMFIRDLVAESSKIAQEKKANTVTLMHLYINTIYKTHESINKFTKFDFLRDQNNESMSEGDGISGSVSGFSTITSSNGPGKTRASKGATKRKSAVKSPKSKAEPEKTATDTKNLSAAEAMIKKEAEMSKILSSTAINDSEGESIVFENENYSDGEE